MTYITGIDCSHHQWLRHPTTGKVDFNHPPDWGKAASLGAKFGVARCTVGVWRDSTFEQNWMRMKEAGMLVGAYHVVAPDQSYSAQMAMFLSHLAKRHLDLVPVLDCELTNGVPRAGISSVIYSCAKFIAKEFGKNPIIYTRQSWWDLNTSPASYWKDYPLWVAHYTGAEKPLLPRDWKQWAFWQYSADGNLVGDQFGAKSKSIDLNRWNGTLDSLLAFCGQEAEQPPEPPPADTRPWQVKNEIMWNYGLKQGWWK